MEKLWKKISGLFFASVMAVTLTGKANADSDEAALPEPAPTAAVEPAAETPRPAAEAPKPAEESAPAPAAEAAPAPVTEAPAAEAAAPAVETAPAEAASAAAEEAPAAEESAPAAEESAPAEENAPAAEASGESAAAEAEAAPAEETPAPAEAAPAEAEEAAAEEDEEAPAEADEAEAEEAETDLSGEEAEPEEVSSEAPEGIGVSAPATTSRRSYALAGISSGSRLLRSSSEDTETEEKILSEDVVYEINSAADITIKTAGLRHISSLTSDGDVFIVGTGILLVDNVDLLQGCSVYLQPIKEIYGENGGTAALFVFTGEESGVKTYTLINGTYSDSEGDHIIPAILDEEYEIPAGISLVVPAGSEMILQPVNTRVDRGVDANGTEVSKTSYSTTDYPPCAFEGDDTITSQTSIYNSTAPVLTIAEGASLFIESGGSLPLRTISYSPFDAAINAARLIINGHFSLGSGVYGGLIDINSTGTVSGSGILTSRITVRGTRTTDLTLNVTDSYLRLEETNLTGLNISEGNTETSLLYLGPSSIDSLVTQSGSLRILSSQEYGGNDALTIKKNVSGAGTVEAESGVIVIAEGAAVGRNDSVTVYSFNHYPGIASIYDYTGTLTGSDLPRVEPNGIHPGQSVIPVIGMTIEGGTNDLGGIHDGAVTGSVTEHNDSIPPFDPAGAETLTLAKLKAAYPTYFEEKTKVVLEVCQGGVYSLVTLDGSAGVPVASVERIFIFTASYPGTGMGGGTLTSTDTTYTGSGILGGSGAGSVAGGQRRLAITGDRAPASDTKPDPDPSPAPAPAPAPSPAQDADELLVWTEEVPEENCYELHIEIEGEPVTRLAEPVTVRMAYTPADPAETRPLFVVFRNADGTLTVFEATFDPVTGMLVFSADMAGEFIIVPFEFDGELFSEEFYQALAELAEIALLNA